MSLPFFSAHPNHCSAIKFHHSPHPLFPWPRMDAATATAYHRRKDKAIVIMGATGTGKSRLSVDLATLFFPSSEIINSDKMQVYRGLDITTNKIPIHDRNGVPHHLLGDVDPSNGDFTPSDFRRRGGDAVSDIISRRKLPLVVGGSNSFVHALVAERFDEPESNSLFDESNSPPTRSEFRYECCFLWVDVSFPVLSDYLLKRVDDMLDSGMVDELAEFFDPEASDLEDDSASRTGLRKAIGVPEFDRYFREYPPPAGLRDRRRKGAYEDAVAAIKYNTCRLAKRQIGKIMRLRQAGWDLRRVDATAAFRAVLDGGEGWLDIWEREVLEPSAKIVKRFLKELSPHVIKETNLSRY